MLSASTIAVLSASLASLLANAALPATANAAPPKRAAEARVRELRTDGATPARRGVQAPPNILVVVLDDLGIDQMSFPPFGWNAAPEAPSMPVLAEIASQGVSFTNFWATPECSPSRAAMLTGRHGIRTNVVTAIVDPMLPTTQLHPDEITVPKLLREQGYISGMLGKYHLGGGPENTPPGHGYEAPVSTVGLDFYDGYWDLPPSIDTTIGGQVAAGTYDCGGVLGLLSRGAACYPDGTCIEDVNPLTAMAMGATPLLRADGTLAATCAEGVCAAIDFNRTNAYYVWPRTVVSPVGAERYPVPQREYLTNFVSRRTVEWIENARAQNRPWIAFATHSSAHTPVQPPPPTLVGAQPNDFTCAPGTAGFRNQYRLMCESVDRSIGEMLVGLGLGSWGPDGFELGDLAAANTMLVVFNDNGTYALNVLPPFSPANSKQTVYETGVRSPCIVAGPQVVAPGRAVDSAVSIVDLFGLLCDAGGADWQSVATPTRRIDAVPMTAYLTDPAAAPAREFSFAVYRQGTFQTGEVGSCIVAGGVIDGLITSPGLCEANGGCWASPEAEAPYSITNYCDMLSTDPSNAVFECGGVAYCTLPPSMQAEGLCADGTTPMVPPTLAQYAVRRGLWKLVVIESPECLAPDNCSVRLYRLNEPNPPLEPGMELPDGSPGVWNPLAEELPPVAAAEYAALKAELVRLLLSEPKSPADGNLDGIVDARDLAGLFNEWGEMGFWDTNTDGVVDGDDLAFVLGSWGEVQPAADLVPACILDDPRVLVREYDFEGSLDDSAGSGVDAVAMGKGTVADGVYLFGSGSGLRIPLAGGDFSDYAIELDVVVDSTEFAFSKFIDFGAQSQDRGFYRGPNGSLFFLDAEVSAQSATPVGLGVPYTVRLTRDAIARTVTLSIDGVAQWILGDPQGAAVPIADELVLFADDAVTNFVETCSGRLEAVRIYSNTAQ
ncbi:MAG: hypothetical protein RI967_233 [Planctomycetota bacterium]